MGKKKTKQNLKEARHRCPFDIVTCLVNDRFSVSVSSQFQKKKKKTASLIRVTRSHTPLYELKQGSLWKKKKRSLTLQLNSEKEPSVSDFFFFFGLVSEPITCLVAAGKITNVNNI